MSRKVRVSATLIVRDEERFLRGCLESIQAVVDEIVVVDTGSVDRTIEIAKSFDVVLLHRVWQDDFAWARNEALAAAAGDWILYIDADERLRLPAGALLRDELDDPLAFAARVLFHPKVNTTPSREYRLFRNDPRLRFRGAMHETIIPDLNRLQTEIGAKVIDSAAVLQHLGYEGDQSHKAARNLPMLRAAIAKEPERLFYWNHLAETLEASGNSAEALAVSAEGFQRAQSILLSSPEIGVAATLAWTHGRLLHDSGGDALPVVDTGLAMRPGSPSLLLLKARILLDRDEPGLALPILEDLAATDGGTFSDPALSHDRRIFDVYAHDLMGVALLRLGRRAEAAEAFERAALGAPEDLFYRVKAAALRG